MAIAKRCDRCGKFYEYYSTDDNANAVGLCLINKIGDAWIVKKSVYDLCPECLLAFDAFINPLKQEVKGNG